jgi:hypothetical protein
VWYLKGMGIMALIILAIWFCSSVGTWLVKASPEAFAIVFLVGAVLIGGWFIGQMTRGIDE